MNPVYKVSPKNKVSPRIIAEGAVDQILKNNLVGLILQDFAIIDSKPIIDYFYKLMVEKKCRVREIDCASERNLYDCLKKIMKYHKKRTSTNNPRLKRWLKTYFVLKDVTDKFKDIKKNFYVVDVDSCGYS